jgi:hypothetical protein
MLLLLSISDREKKRNFEREKGKTGEPFFEKRGKKRQFLYKGKIRLSYENNFEKKEFRKT